MSNVVGMIIGLLLTLLIYSYVFGDNPLYRLAVHVLVGVSAAYAAVVMVRQVLIPVYQQLQSNPGSADNLIWYVPLFFAVLLLLQRLPTIGWLGNNTLALIIGIGTAVALIGAITGTLLPQLTPGQTTAVLPQQGLIVALLAAATLLSFRFTGRAAHKEHSWTPPRWQRLINGLGQGVLAITFGVLFASLLNTSLVLLVDRIGFFIAHLLQLLA